MPSSAGGKDTAAVERHEPGTRYLRTPLRDCGL